jgi:hypothetical protein
MKVEVRIVSEETTGLPVVNKHAAGIIKGQNKTDTLKTKHIALSRSDIDRINIG